MSTGKQSSSAAWFLVDGYDLIAAKLQELRVKIASIMEPSTGIGDETMSTSPTGVSELTLMQGGAFLSTAARGSHAALKSPSSDPNGTARLVCLGLAGHTVGGLFIGMSGMFQVAYEAVSPVAALTKCNAAYAGSGDLEYGQIVQPLAEKTVDWNTKTLGTVVDYLDDPGNLAIPVTSSSVADPSVITCPVPHGFATGQVVFIADHEDSTPDINGEQTVTVISTTTFSIDGVEVTVGGTGGTVKAANTLNGGAGYQQVTALTGLTGYVGKIRDSADDTTYADLVTFTDVTAAPAKERVEVSGTVERYLSHDGNVAGTGSLKPFSGFARG